ncbi:hypothetical protein ASH01_18035 [Terrabacter sp. Soil811]|uniref:GPR1/FUN34/YaaH family transporter n=1 Tax=Terrabacter sp. Soil811 TaxID=1736419 RepID=UPI0006F6C262|nr:GPR1/FUN34/YaaH family transporter [Terrabacter sp. Soil811]KRF41974.1 hypothetical protein ASH01_18035 [Terrabacter sp. Soil811]
MSTQSSAAHESETRIVVRPLGNPLPLGFLALMVATTAVAMLQLGVLQPDQGHVVALGLLVLTVPLQTIACVLGFLARDPVAGTGMGVLAGTWAAVGFTMLGSAPGVTSPALGVLLLGSAVAMTVPTAAATTKLAGLAVLGCSSVRFAITGIGQLTGSPAWLTAAGWVGVVLALVAAYAALAFELEDVRHTTVLPIGRRGAGASTMTAPARDELAPVAHEAGVRQEL